MEVGSNFFFSILTLSGGVSDF